MQAVKTAVILLLAGCAPGETPVPEGAPAMGVDSIVLERSVCFGFCPAYRLRLTASGQIAFESRNPRSAAKTAADSVASARVGALFSLADAAGFFALPDTVLSDSMLCGNVATDHPTATVTIFRPIGAKHVVDYLGCHAGSDPAKTATLTQLRAFEDSIDNVANSGRWTKPGERQ